MKKYLWFIVYLLPVLVMSCNLVKISVSDYRNPEPVTILAGRDIQVSSTGSVRINKTDFLPSSVRIKSRNRMLYIDPLAISDTMKADYILITHAHPDHFSKDDISRLSKSETLIICPGSVAKKLGKDHYNVRVVKPGDSVFIDDNLRVEVTFAYTLEPAFLWLKAHPRSKGNAGYIVDINGVRIYHAGDTDKVPELDSISNIKLALVPVAGDKLTMSTEKAAELVNQLKPGYAAPMHYKKDASGELDLFRELIQNQTEVVILE